MCQKNQPLVNRFTRAAVFSSWLQAADERTEQPAATAKAIGYVMKTEGEAVVIVGGKAQPAKVGMPVFVGSSIKTGENGSLG